MKYRLVKVVYGMIMLVLYLCVVLCACTTNHYMSVTADTMENPSIVYSDSTSIYNPL